MAATRGPVPKRSDQRRRTNKDPAGPVTKGTAAPQVAIPPADPEWHPSAARWYAALPESGQSKWYEPSDWAEAHVWAGILSQQLGSGKPSAMMLAAWGAASARLMVTEGDRRRMRMELVRGKAEDPDETAAVASMAAYRGKPRAV
jgi:hypothetical protein